VPRVRAARRAGPGPGRISRRPSSSWPRPATRTASRPRSSVPPVPRVRQRLGRPPEPARAGASRSSAPGSKP